MPTTVVPENFHQLVTEILTTPIPYSEKPDLASKEAFYCVCDYRFIPKGTVLLCLRAGDSKAQVHGYLPQSSTQERAALYAFLAEHITEAKALDLASLEQSELRIFTEEQGVQRLLEIQQFLALQKAPAHRVRFH